MQKQLGIFHKLFSIQLILMSVSGFLTEIFIACLGLTTNSFDYFAIFLIIFGVYFTLSLMAGAMSLKRKSLGYKLSQVVNFASIVFACVFVIIGIYGLYTIIQSTTDFGNYLPSEYYGAVFLLLPLGIVTLIIHSFAVKYFKDRKDCLE